MKKLITLALLLSAFSCFKMKAQTTTYGELSTWFTLLNRVQFAKHWSFSNELHDRHGKVMNVQGIFIERPSIDYLLNKNVEFSVGYSYVNTHSYTPYNLPIPKTENNVWEQVILKNDVGKVHFLHRFRQENRWLDKIVTDGDGSRLDGKIYGNRFRYRFDLSTDIYKIKDSEKAFFFHAFDEFWFTQNKHLLPADFARNWMYLGVGFKFNKSCNIQIGYMNQYDKINATKYISTSIIQTTFVKNFDFSKKIEAPKKAE